jgi:competence protein ComEA
MEAAATTKSGAPPLPETLGGESPPSANSPLLPRLPLVPPPVNISATWPRSAQLAAAFLLGLALALLGIQMWSMSRWSTRPLDLSSNKPTRYRIDLNQANREQLLQVPGIGERTAEKIEVFRDEHGPFRGKEELTQIHGIGPAKYEKMSDWLTVRPASANVKDDLIASRPSAKTLAKDSKATKLSKKEENLKEPIDVNQADLKELQRLPGIGPKLAQRIMDERAKKPFQSVEDLRRVSGIGPKILERLRPYVKVRSTSNHFALDSAGKSR